jgi:predicted nucleic acid-binding protein
VTVVSGTANPREVSRILGHLESLEISGECNISAYDAQFVALARELGVPLITQDRKLLRVAPGEAMSMKQYLVSAPG